MAVKITSVQLFFVSTLHDHYVLNKKLTNTRLIICTYFLLILYFES
jgi:hypothetical protein